MKVNFEAAWDEVGDEFEKEETFTLSTVKTLEGKCLVAPSLTWLPFRTLSCTAAAMYPSSHQRSKATSRAHMLSAGAQSLGSGLVAQWESALSM